MLTSKKSGDSLYIVFAVSNSPPRLETVDVVGRLFLTTRQGNKYCRTTGTQSRDTKRRDFAPNCKAWPSKEVYDYAVAHYIQCRTTIRDLDSVNPAHVSPEDLQLLKDIIKRAKKEKRNAPVPQRLTQHPG